MSDLARLEVLAGTSSASGSAWRAAVDAMSEEASPWTLEASQSADAALDALGEVHTEEESFCSKGQWVDELEALDGESMEDSPQEVPQAIIQRVPLNSLSLLAHTSKTTPECELDSGMVKVADYFLYQKETAPTTAQGEAHHLGLDRKSLRSYREVCAAISFSYERFVW